MTWLFLFPLIAAASALPQTSDVVLIYENVSNEEQTKYNYLFTVEGDDTIYPCSANRCSVEPWRDRESLTLKIYQLPEGYPRVATIVDQTTLAEYKAAAEQNFTIKNILTNPSSDDSGRTFQQVTLHADGSAEVETITQAKNAQAQEASGYGTWRRYLWPVLIVSAILILGIGIWLGRRKVKMMSS